MTSPLRDSEASELRNSFLFQLNHMSGTRCNASFGVLLACSALHRRAKVPDKSDKEQNMNGTSISNLFIRFGTVIFGAGLMLVRTLHMNADVPDNSDKAAHEG
eukprot:2230620-Amphidinium_carterae.8